MKFQLFSKLVLVVSIFAMSCQGSNVYPPQKKSIAKARENNIDSLRQRMNENINFIGDTLLPGKQFLLKNYLKNYQPDTCGIMAYSNTLLKEGFDGIKNMGDINGDKINDSVFVMVPFNFCDEGQSYCFLDTSLPRLYTDSYCCHPDNIFSIGDIDEDGISDICIFYSSCVSRFKRLIAYSLKNGQWQQVGVCDFDIFVKQPDKEKRVRKVSKGKFEMLEIVINDFEKNSKGDREWKQFSF